MNRSRDHLLGMPLSPREIQVLVLMGTGKDYAAIGAVLGVSSNTIKTTCERMFCKLGVHTRAEAIVYGCHSGLIAPPATPMPEPVQPPEPPDTAPGIRITPALANRIGLVLDLIIAQRPINRAALSIHSHAAAVLAELRPLQNAARGRATAPVPTQRTGNHQ